MKKQLTLEDRVDDFVEEVSFVVVKTFNSLVTSGVDKELAPSLHFRTLLGATVLLAQEIPGGRDSLPAASRAISKALDAYAVAFTSEGWQRSGSTQQAALESEDRQEVLMVMIDASTGTVQVFWPINRDSAGTPTLGERSVHKNCCDTRGSHLGKLLHPSLKVS